VKPTVRDLAESASDLRGYAIHFRVLAAQADKEGVVMVPAAMLARAADFLDSVTNEMLELIGPHPPEPPT